MRHNLIYALILVIALSLALAEVWRRSDTSLDKQIADLRDTIINEQWNTATDTLASLEADWERRKTWMSVTKSTQKISNGDRALAQLKSSVRLKDKVTAVGHLSDFEALWEDLKGPVG